MARIREEAVGALPYLRRYARALTGSQQHGDEWVRMCVEVLLQQPDLLKSGATTKFDVFTVFHKLQHPFAALEPATSEGASGTGDRLKAGLTDIPLRQKQVLLLTALENFTIEQSAAILGIDVGQAETDLAQARNELKRIASVRVLIIEDEAVIALDVANIVKDAGHEVVGIAPTEQAAIALAKQHAPHLILADIQLRDGDSGIVAVRQILKSSSAPVIFVTAYPERLLTGIGVEPAFVITKPFGAEDLQTAIAQALDSVAA